MDAQHPTLLIPTAVAPYLARQHSPEFSAVANATPVMIWLAGTDGLCQWFNTGWLTFTGRSLEQEQGNGWSTGVHPDDLTYCLDHYQTHFDQRAPFQMEYRLRHHGGQYRWIIDSGMPRFDDDGKFLGYIGSCVDIDNVRRHKDQLAVLAESVPGVVYQYLSLADGTGRLEYVSRGIETLFGVHADAACADIRVLLDRIMEPDRDPYLRSISECTRTLTPWHHQFRIKGLTAPVTWVQGQATPHPEDNGAVRWSGLFTDITHQKQLELQLQLSASVFSAVQESVIITDAQAHIIDVNDGFCRQTGYSRDEVLGQNPRMLKSGYQPQEFYDDLWSDLNLHGFWRGEVFNRRKSGEIYAVLLNITAVRDQSGQLRHYVAVATNITDLKAQQELLQRIAHYDALTHLPNRVLLTDRLHQVIALAQRQRSMAALCFIDLDGFKQINDTHGHALGDVVLKTVAQRMHAVMRASDTAARLGGDEFVLLLNNVESEQALQPMLQRLLDALRAPIDLAPDVKGQVSASIGVSLFPHHGSEPDTLLRLADQAMYAAKRGGKNTYAFSAG